MSEVTQEKKNNNDEIDLLDLFRRMGKTIGGWANAIWRAFLISVVFLLKRWLPLGISLFAGVGVSYILKTTSESFYTSDIVIRNNVLSNADMIAYINRLHTFCKENNKTALTSSLSDNPETVGNILDIQAFWIIDKGKDGVPDEVDYNSNHNIYDTVNVRMLDRFNIRATIKAPQELTSLQASILSFIKKDLLFQQRNEVRKRQNQDMLTRLGYDISQLDTLQKIKLKQETKSRLAQSTGQIIFMQDQKTQLVYTDVYSLYTRKQALESERDLYPDIVTVISDFNLPAKPDNGTLYYGMKIIPAFFVITLLILIILANIKQLKEVYNKY